MVAMLWLEELQDTFDVTSPVVLLPNVAVAVKFCVPVGFTHALIGESESETTTSEAGKKPPQLLSKIAIATGVANRVKYAKRLMCSVSPTAGKVANLMLMFGAGDCSPE
jgi:hypothetical protein